MKKTTTAGIFGAIAVLCAPLIMLQMMNYNFIGTRPAAVFFLLLDLYLIVSNRLYREGAILLPLSFVVWMECSGILMGSDLMKVLGGRSARSWYLGLFAFMVAYLSDKEGRKRLFKAFCAVLSAFGSTSFVYFIYNAVKGLLTGVNIEGLPGIFINGRLRAYGNANVLGTVAAAVFAASLLLFAVLRAEHKGSERRAYGRILSGLTVLAAVIAFVTLSLSRSRGSIVSVSLFASAYAFRLLYIAKNRRNQYKRLGRIVPAAILTGVFTFLLSMGIKAFFDAAMISLTDPAARELTREALTPYGMGYALNTLTDRTMIWPAVVDYLKERPVRFLTGITAAENPDRMINYIYAGRPELTAVHAHNEFMQALYVTGIPGLMLTVLLLAGWSITGLKAFFSRKAESMIPGLTACFLSIAIPLAMVEVYSLPGYGVHLLNYVFFACMGILMGSYRKKPAKLKALPGMTCVVLTLFLAVSAAFAGVELLESRRETKFYAQKEETLLPAAQARDLMEAQVADMNTPEYWIKVRENAGADVTKTILTLPEIEKLNELNRKEIRTGGMELALEDLGDTFNTDALKTLFHETYRVPEDPASMIVDGKPTTAEYWQSLVDVLDYDSMKKLADVTFGFAAKRTTLRKLPTVDVMYASSDPEGMYDEMAASDLQALEPVAILWESEDHAWDYVLTYGYGGFVPAEYIVHCADREEWLAMQKPDARTETLVVTAKEVTLPVNGEEITFYMGTRLPAYKEGNTYIAMIPARAADGSCECAYVPVEPSENIHAGFLPYTEENVLKQAFRLLDTPYGWAGTGNTFDCSGFTREIFLTFGLALPRTAEPQALLAGADTRHIFFTAGEKLDYVNNLPAGSLIYFPGHIVLYLGSVDGTPYCMSAVGSLCTTSLNAGERIYANSTIISDMTKTTRANGVSWLQSAEKITVIR